MIVLDNVTKFYKTNDSKKYILKNVSLTIPSGVNVGILGRNGAGKSTLLRMLGGIDFPNSGKIYSDKTFSWPMGLAGGFQQSMTGRQNAKFVARIFSKSEKEIKKILDFVKEFSELDDYFDMPIKTYSSGMRSRLTFAMSLAFDFDYLLIDETLSVGDARFKKKSKDALMKKIEKSNVLMVSHSMGDLKNICDVGIVVNNGKMEYYDNIEEAIERYDEINIFGDDIKNTDMTELFYNNREQFVKLVKEAYYIEEDNNAFLFFIFKYNNRFYKLKFEVNNEFIKNINPLLHDLFEENEKKRDDKTELKIINNFFGFMLRFDTKFFINEKLKRNDITDKRKKYFLHIIKNNKKAHLLDEEEKSEILKKIENMESL